MSTIETFKSGATAGTSTAQQSSQAPKTRLGIVPSENIKEKQVRIAEI